MLFLERARFIHIGAPDCRIDDLTSLALDDRGRPVDTVVWLRNGGGKTVLLGLFFAHLLPGARDFLKGKKENARFSDHVLDSDTSYVTARWVGDPIQLSLTGEDSRPRLVTGRAVERKAGFAGTTLPDLFFSFRPLPGVLDLDSVPWAVEGRRLDLAGFHAELDRLSRAHPELELVTTDKDGVWAGHLRRQGLDPEIIRYQLQMNAGEGEAATGFMQFRTSDEFVDFVAGVVTPREALDTIEGEVRTYAAKLRRLPEQRCELELIERALPALRAHGDNVAGKERLEERLRELLAEAAGLRGQLQRALELAMAETAEAEEQRRRLDEEANEAQQERSHLKALALEAAYLVAVHRWETAREELRTASGRKERHKRQAEDWRLSEPVAQQRALKLRQQELQAQLTERERDAEPRRLAAERAGSALRLRLLELAAAARQEERSLRGQASGHGDRSQAAWREAEQAAGELERLEAQVADATRLLRALDDERGRLRTAGLLGAGETAEAAAARWQAEESGVAGRLVTIGQRLKTIQGERAGLQERRLEAAGERKGLDGERRQAEARIAELSRDRESLWADAALGEVCEVARPDLWAERERLETALERRAQELSAALVATELGAATDRHSRAALESTGYLPPALDVERALDVLKEAGVATAYPGWEYLRRMRAETAAATLISAPELAGGILLNDPEELGPALDALEASGVHPTSVVALGAVEELSPGRGGAARLWRPHPALLDRAAGEDELAHLADRLSAVDDELAAVRCRLDAVRDLRARLSVFHQRWPTGMLTALDEQVTDLDRRIRGVEARDEALMERDATLEQDAASLEVEREDLLKRSQRIPAVLAELRGLASSEIQEPAWRAAVADGPARMQAAADRRAATLLESEQEARQAELARDEAARKRATAEEWERQAGGL